jgi:hypothetical protein
MPVLKNPLWEKAAQERAKGLGKTKAFLNAGFEAKSNAGQQAFQLFEKPEIKKRVNELQKRIVKKTELTLQREDDSTLAVMHRLGITREKILSGIWWTYQTALRGEAELDENGVQTGRFRGRPDRKSALAAGKMLGQECFGMFADKVEVGQPGDFARLSDEELGARLDADLAALGVPEAVRTQLALTFAPADDGTKKDE